MSSKKARVTSGESSRSPFFVKLEWSHIASEKSNPTNQRKGAVLSRGEDDEPLSRSSPPPFPLLLPVFAGKRISDGAQ
jgi:hypothetical protein